MQVIETTIPDVKIIQPKIFRDDRGFFLETFQQEKFNSLINDDRYTFVQDNHSQSSQGVLRGLHYQTQNTQGKLVRAIQGKIFDVCVDMRESSVSFGQWFGVMLDTELHQQLWVPPGFAHGFYVQSEVAQIEYKCTALYHPESEVSVVYDDTTLGINWPIQSPPILSDKDKKGLTFDNAPKFI